MGLLIEIIIEILVQGLGDAFFDWLLRSRNPTLRALGSSLLSALAGVILGAASLVFFKSHLISSPELRVAMLLGLPLLNGFAMSHIGRWFARNQKDRSAFEYFAPAFVFSLAFGTVRFFGGE
ncbi:MAG TPA: hypothetical protein VEF04_15220 [Blastocatellia bacterium]|nr:hypothetical protein [Blastocatellia bacterium]